MPSDLEPMSTSTPSRSALITTPSSTSPRRSIRGSATSPLSSSWPMSISSSVLASSMCAAGAAASCGVVGFVKFSKPPVPPAVARRLGSPAAAQRADAAHDITLALEHPSRTRTVRDAAHPRRRVCVYESRRWPIFRAQLPGEYRRRCDVSLPCSGWERVGPSRSNHRGLKYADYHRRGQASGRRRTPRHLESHAPRGLRARQTVCEETVCEEADVRACKQKGGG